MALPTLPMWFGGADPDWHCPCRVWQVQIIGTAHVVWEVQINGTSGSFSVGTHAALMVLLNALTVAI